MVVRHHLFRPGCGDVRIGVPVDQAPDQRLPQLARLQLHNARYDGAIDTTGWWADPSAGNTWTNEMPRCWIDRQPSEHLYNKVNIIGPAYDRWIGIRQTTTGDLDSPFLYPQVYTQVTGFAGAVRGHGQPMVYLPPDVPCYGCPPNSACVPYVMCPPPNSNPDVHCCAQAYCGSCGAAATRRLDRHTIESIINSVGGSETKLAVWLAQAGPVDNPSLDYYRGQEGLLRHTLAVFRANNIPRILFWSGQSSLLNIYAWEHAEELVNRVYAAIVVEAKVVQGEVMSEDDAHPERLEYTLRRNGAPYTIDIQPGDGDEFHGVEVQVQVQVAEGYRSDHMYEINIEDSDVFGANGEGRLYALDLNPQDPTAPSAWRKVPTAEGELSYLFLTPDGSSRRTFMLQPMSSEVFVSGAGKMRLRIVHVTEATNAFARFDLVQVVPIPIPVGGAGEGTAEALQADLNFDDEVNTDDLAMFTAAYIDETVLADVDGDGDTDTGDVSQFLTSYATEAP